MLGQKNITHLVVGKDDDLATSSEAREDLIAGQIGVFKDGSRTATTSALSAGERFKVVFKNVDGNIIESPFIDYDNIVSKNAVLYSADSEQKTYVGYNGTTGSVSVNNSDEYYIHLDRQDSSKTWSEHSLYKLVAAYKSDASATQTEIVDALVANAYKNLFVEKQRSGRWVTKVGRINAAAVTASNDFINDVKLVKDSTTIVGAEQVTITGSSGTATITAGGVSETATFNTNTDTTASDFVTASASAFAAVGITVTNPSGSILLFTPANAYTYFDLSISNATGDLDGTLVEAFEYAAGTSLAVGDFIRIGSVGGGTALTSSVYKVTALSGNTLTLDVGILEATGTYAAATSDIEVIAASGEGNWGIMFESQPVKFVPGLFKNQQVTFNVGLSDAFDNTLVTEDTSPAKGNGTYEEVAEIEQFLRGNRGEPFRVADYPVSKNLNATSGEVYDTINVQFTNNNSTDLDSDVKSWIGLVIFTENESSGTPHTDLKTVLGIS